MTVALGEGEPEGEPEKTGLEETEPEEVVLGEIEAAPDDLIANFLDVNDYLVQLATQTLEQPSAETIVMTDGLKREAIKSIAPMVETQFFRGSGDQYLVSTAAAAVIKTTARLWETATELRPDEPTHNYFDPNVHPAVVGALTADSEGDEARVAIAQAMSMLCNTYEQAVENLFEKVITSEAVINYGLMVQERAEHQRRLINFGSVAAATFIGTALANYLAGKKRY